MTRNIRATLLTLALSTTMAAPASAGPLEDCYDAVLDRCAEAMKDANPLEKFALGVICTGMLVGCASKLAT